MRAHRDSGAVDSAPIALMERVVEEDSATGGLHSVVEIEEARSCPPQMVGWIDAVTSVLAPPVTIVETGHGLGEVTTADVAFEHQRDLVFLLSLAANRPLDELDSCQERCRRKTANGFGWRPPRSSTI